MNMQKINSTVSNEIIKSENENCTMIAAEAKIVAVSKSAIAY